MESPRRQFFGNRRRDPSSHSRRVVRCRTDCSTPRPIQSTTWRTSDEIESALFSKKVDCEKSGCIRIKDAECAEYRNLPSINNQPRRVALVGVSSTEISFSSSVEVSPSSSSSSVPGISSLHLDQSLIPLIPTNGEAPSPIEEDRRLVLECRTLNLAASSKLSKNPSGRMGTNRWLSVYSVGGRRAAKESGMVPSILYDAVVEVLSRRDIAEDCGRTGLLDGSGREKGPKTSGPKLKSDSAEAGTANGSCRRNHEYSLSNPHDGTDYIARVEQLSSRFRPTRRNVMTIFPLIFLPLATAIRARAFL